MLTWWGKRYQRDGLILDGALYPPPGELVAVAPGRLLHVHQQGTGAATVVLESGIAASSLSWRTVDHRLTDFATVYSYDRAGFGWSPYHPGPKVARALVEDMRAALAAVGAPTPRILVGHSFGGLLMRLYAGMYPEEVAGVVLVDALSPEEWHPLDARRQLVLRRGAAIARRAAWMADHGLVRLALRSLERGRKTLPRLFALFGGPGLEGQATRLFSQLRKLPPSTWPIIRAHWCRPEGFLTMAEYLADLPASCLQATIAPGLEDLPLIVLAAEKGHPGHQGRQARLAKLSRRGDYRMIEGTGHWLMLDAPTAVVEAVAEIAALRGLATAV